MAEGPHLRLVYSSSNGHPPEEASGRDAGQEAPKPKENKVAEDVDCDFMNRKKERLMDALGDMHLLTDITFSRVALWLALQPDKPEYGQYFAAFKELISDGVLISSPERPGTYALHGPFVKKWLAMDFPARSLYTFLLTVTKSHILFAKNVSFESVFRLCSNHPQLQNGVVFTQAFTQLRAAGILQPEDDDIDWLAWIPTLQKQMLQEIQAMDQNNVTLQNVCLALGAPQESDLGDCYKDAFDDLVQSGVLYQTIEMAETDVFHVRTKLADVWGNLSADDQRLYNILRGGVLSGYLNPKSISYKNILMILNQDSPSEESTTQESIAASIFQLVKYGVLVRHEAGGTGKAQTYTLAMW